VSAPALVFVYNADSGFVNTLLDIGHKIVSPSTYACRLCALTHSTFAMREEWRRFVADLGVPIEFLHRDELQRRYGIRGTALPVVFRRDDRRLDEWITAAEIGSCRSLSELEALIRARLGTAAVSGV
jgi:hypothetical protein